jgi:2-Cys peroxiredoxin 5
VQVPGYLAKQDALKAKGISDVYVYCVNDGAVMTGWAKDQGVVGSMITFLGDPTGEFTRQVGMVITHEGPCGVLGPNRCKRFCLVVDDGKVTHVALSEAEGDPAGDNDANGPVIALTKVETILEKL